MADISDVNVTVIKDLYQRLESLGCKAPRCFPLRTILRLLTRSSSNNDTRSVLSAPRHEINFLCRSLNVELLLPRLPRGNDSATKPRLLLDVDHHLVPH